MTRIGGVATKKPLVVEVIRYGHPVTGIFEPHSVPNIARFILGMDAESWIGESTIAQVTQPNERWNDHYGISIWDENGHQSWLPLELGDYVIRGVKGEVYPCKYDIFQETFYPGIRSEENLTHDEETLKKVYKGLELAGYKGMSALDIVNMVQNQGILFREHAS